MRFEWNSSPRGWHVAFLTPCADRNIIIRDSRRDAGSIGPGREDAAVLKFFETSTRNLLDYEAAAGVGHHVAFVGP